MSKKRKTRDQKSQTRVHKFTEPVYKIAGKSSELSPDEATDSKVTSNRVAPWVISDLRMVLMIIGFMILAILVVSFFVYRTNYFDQIFSKLNISY